MKDFIQLSGEIHNSVLAFLHQNYSFGKLNGDNLHEAVEKTISKIRSQHGLSEDLVPEDLVSKMTTMGMLEMKNHENYLKYLVTSYAGDIGLSLELLQSLSHLVNLWSEGATGDELDVYIKGLSTQGLANKDQRCVEVLTQIWLASKIYWEERRPESEIDTKFERKWVPYLADAVAGALTFELGPGAAVCAGFASWFWDEVSSHY